MITKYKKLIKKHKKLFLLLVCVGLLIQPKSAQAIITIFELGTNQLDALDFVDNVVLEIIIWLGLMAVESAVFMYSAAKILQWAIEFPIILGISDPTKNPLVYGGWHFISGLANLCFALLFAITALAYILKIESFKAEKVLPKLIITALLINFSLVFVGFFVDISNLIQGAIINVFGAGDLVALAVEPLKTNVLDCAMMLLAIPAAYLVAMWIPYANVISLVAIATFLLTEAIFGSAAKTIILILFNLVMGGIFLKYAWRFISRVAMIYILAILSPLAFITRIFEGDAKKYYNEWFKLLVSWCTLGIHMLFFLGLGLKLITNIPAPSFTVAGFSFPSFLYNYIFLLVYLAVASDYIDKHNPENVDFIMKQGQSLVGNVGKITQGFRERNANLWLVDEEKRQKGYSERIISGQPLSIREGLRRAMGTAIATPTRWAMKTFSHTTPEEEDEKMIKTIQEKVKSASTEQLSRVIENSLKRRLVAENIFAEKDGSWIATKKGIQESLIKLAKDGKLKDFINKQIPEDQKKIENMAIKAYTDISKDKKRDADASAIAMSSQALMDEAIKIKFPSNMAEINKLKFEANKLRTDADGAKEAERFIEIGEQTIKYGNKIIKDGKAQMKASGETLRGDNLTPENRRSMNKMISEGKEMIQEGTNKIQDGEKMKSDAALQLNNASIMYEKAREIDKKVNDNYQQLFNTTAKGLPDDQIKNLDKDLLKSKYGAEWIISEKSNRLSEVAKTFGQEVIDSIEKGMDGKDLFNLAKTNPDLVNFLHSNAAHNLGLGLPSEYKKRDIASNKEFQKFMADARKEHQKEIKEGKAVIDVIKIEKDSKAPQATQAMSENALREIASARQVEKLIDQQRDTLHIFTKNYERMSDDIAKLESNSNKNAEQIKYLDKLKKDIMPEQNKKLEITVRALETLEAKQEISLKEIKKEIKETSEETREKINAERLEDKSKKL